MDFDATYIRIDFPKSEYYHREFTLLVSFSIYFFYLNFLNTCCYDQPLRVLLTFKSSSCLMSLVLILAWTFDSLLCVESFEGIVGIPEL